jgi:alpha-glucosidase
MRAVIDEYGPGERVLIGEMYLDLDQVVQYYGAAMDECHLPFNFQLILTEWNARKIRALVEEYEAALPPGGWPNWVIGNHDQHRIASRVGPAQARVANMLLLTLRGTPTCYYGDELGMENVPIPLEFVQDPPALNQPDIAHIFGRDPERTPMQWDASPNAGFTAPDVQPWLPVADDYAQKNVAVERDDPASMLTLFRELTNLRQSEPALHAGAYATVDTDADDVFAYLRSAGETRFLIVLNFGARSHTLDLSAAGEQGEIAVATNGDPPGTVTLQNLKLMPDEGLLIRL